MKKRTLKLNFYVFTIIIFILFAFNLSIAMEYETEPNNDMTNADALTLGQQIQGQLSSSSDEDWFFFDASSAGVVYIKFDLTICALSGYWKVEVRNSSDEVLAGFTTDYCVYEHEWEMAVANSGTYYIVVYCPVPYSYYPDPYILTVDTEHEGSSSLTIFPSSSKFVTTQGFDLTLIVEAPDLSVVGGSATLDGSDITAALVGCIIPGTLVSGGETFRCPGLTGGTFGTGTHTLSITLDLSDGSSVNDSVIWEVKENTEP